MKPLGDATIKITDDVCKKHNTKWADWQGLNDVQLEQLVLDIYTEVAQAAHQNVIDQIKGGWNEFWN